MKVVKHVFLANFLGLPGYSVPVAHVKTETYGEEHSLPIGFQIIGDHWTDGQLLEFANRIEVSYINEKAEKPPLPMFYHDPLKL